MSARKNNLASILVTVLFILLIVGAIGGLVAWLARSEGLTVYVQYNDKRYTKASVKTSLGQLKSGEHVFTVGSLVGENVEYSVSISPNADADFDFVAKNKRVKWSTVDCSTAFDVECDKDKFTVTIADDMTITNFLRSKYGDEVRYASTVEDIAEYFVITVKTSYGLVAMTFGFVIGDKPYAGNAGLDLAISTDHIVF